MLAELALVWLKKTIKPASLVMVARPAVVVALATPVGSPKNSWALLVIAMELAEVALRNIIAPETAFVSDVTPDMSALTILKRPSLVTLPMMAVGAKGIVSVSSNLVPAEMVAMVRAALDGNYAKAYAWHRRLYPLFRDQFVETNPIPIKAAMAMAGLLEEEYRLPLCELAPEHREKLAATLKRCGILS